MTQPQQQKVKIKIISQQDCEAIINVLNSVVISVGEGQKIANIVGYLKDLPMQEIDTQDEPKNEE